MKKLLILLLLSISAHAQEIKEEYIDIKGTSDLVVIEHKGVRCYLTSTRSTHANIFCIPLKDIKKEDK